MVGDDLICEEFAAAGDHCVFACARLTPENPVESSRNPLSLHVCQKVSHRPCVVDTDFPAVATEHPCESIMGIGAGCRAAVGSIAVIALDRGGAASERRW